MLFLIVVPCFDLSQTSGDMWPMAFCFMKMFLKTAGHKSDSALFDLTFLLDNLIKRN